MTVIEATRFVRTEENKRKHSFIVTQLRRAQTTRVAAHPVAAEETERSR